MICYDNDEPLAGCKCKGGCKTKACGCRKAGPYCTNLCGCPPNKCAHRFVLNLLPVPTSVFNISPSPIVNSAHYYIAIFYHCNAMIHHVQGGPRVRRERELYHGHGQGERVERGGGRQVALSDKKLQFDKNWMHFLFQFF